MYIYIYTSIYLSIYLSIYRSIYLSIYIFIYLYLYLYLYAGRRSGRTSSMLCGRRAPANLFNTVIIVIHIHIYIYIYIYIHIYIYIYTYTGTSEVVQHGKNNLRCRGKHLPIQLCHARQGTRVNPNAPRGVSLKVPCAPKQLSSSFSYSTCTNDFGAVTHNERRFQFRLLNHLFRIVPGFMGKSRLNCW